MTVGEIAAWLGATAEGDANVSVVAAAPLENASRDQISFASGPKAQKQAADSGAGCLIVALDFENASGRTVIRTKDPRGAFARLLVRLHPKLRPAAGIHPTAIIDPSAQLGEGVSVGPYVVIGAGTKIGARTVIEAHCVLGARVSIAEDSWLHARVTIYDGVEIGPRAELHSGVVLGGDGFGFAVEGDHFEKFPQVGRLVIGADFEAQANACVDRAALGLTRIGDGVKLDNMVHIGHNCTIGDHVVMAAQTGLGGGASIGHHAVLAGQVGIADNVKVETGAILGAKCGVPSSKIIRAGQTVWGIPARPIRDYLKDLANLSRLESLMERVSRLEEKK